MDAISKDIWLEDKELTQHYNSVGNGKGIATFFSKNYQVEKYITKNSYQITKIKSLTRDIINVYRSSSGVDDEEFCSDLTSLFNPSKETLIVGDFNICYKSEKATKILKTLDTLGFSQLVKKPTHSQGRLIDHVHFFSPGRRTTCEVEQQGQYFTDHDLLKVRTAQGKYHI